MACCDPHTQGVAQAVVDTTSNNVVRKNEVIHDCELGKKIVVKKKVVKKCFPTQHIGKGVPAWKK